jgi:hypothetical protein
MNKRRRDGEKEREKEKERRKKKNYCQRGRIGANGRNHKGLAIRLIGNGT